MQRLRDLYNSLPKEARVGVWVVLSGALTALANYLELIELNDAVLMGVINIILVLVDNRKETVTKRLR